MYLAVYIGWQSIQLYTKFIYIDLNQTPNHNLYTEKCCLAAGCILHVDMSKILCQATATDKASVVFDVHL